MVHQILTDALQVDLTLNTQFLDLSLGPYAGSKEEGWTTKTSAGDDDFFPCRHHDFLAVGTLQLHSSG